MGTIEIKIFGLVSASASGEVAIVALVMVILGYFRYRSDLRTRK
jgi:hypothetical protein